MKIGRARVAAIALTRGFGATIDLQFSHICWICPLPFSDTMIPCAIHAAALSFIRNFTDLDRARAAAMRGEPKAQW